MTTRKKQVPPDVETLLVAGLPQAEIHLVFQSTPAGWLAGSRGKLAGQSWQWPPAGDPAPDRQTARAQEIARIIHYFKIAPVPEQLQPGAASLIFALRATARAGNSAVLAEAAAADRDSLAGWTEAYFAHAVTTAPASRRAQRRDLARFLSYMIREEGTDARSRWTPRLTRSFQDWMSSSVDPDGRRCWSDRTINRTLAHLKTFGRWVHKMIPFPLGDPFAGLHFQPVGSGLEVEKAFDAGERRRLLDAADAFESFARRRDRRRLPDYDLRPCRKGARPWRDRAIIYSLIETGMRRAAAVNLDLSGVNFEQSELTVREKGGQSHTYVISDAGLAAIRCYIEQERPADAGYWHSPALFLAPGGWPGGQGRLSPAIISAIWGKACRLAGVTGKSPHSARHAMGRHIIEETGNIAAVQRQLGHRSASYSAQYVRITRGELRDVLNRRKV